MKIVLKAERLQAMRDRDDGTTELSFRSDRPITVYKYRGNG